LHLRRLKPLPLLIGYLLVAGSITSVGVPFTTGAHASLFDLREHLVEFLPTKNKRKLMHRLGMEPQLAIIICRSSGYQVGGAGVHTVHAKCCPPWISTLSPKRFPSSEKKK
jgi:hypothetical protein